MDGGRDIREVDGGWKSYKGEEGDEGWKGREGKKVDGLRKRKWREREVEGEVK